MIVIEYYSTREDGAVLFRTFSDTNHKIMQKPTMVVYDEAIDIEGAPYEYVETDELIMADDSSIMHQDRGDQRSEAGAATGDTKAKEGNAAAMRHRQKAD